MNNFWIKLWEKKPLPVSCKINISYNTHGYFFIFMYFFSFTQYMKSNNSLIFRWYMYIISIMEEVKNNWKNWHIPLTHTMTNLFYTWCTDWQAHNNAIFDMTWMESEEKILTASGDQTVVMWDVEKQDKLNVFRGHTSSVRCVCAQRGSNGTV